MVGALFDTNILIDHLNAVPQARGEIELFANRAVSIITWMPIRFSVASASRDSARMTSASAIAPRTFSSTRR